jgi:hypothetical protein
VQAEIILRIQKAVEEYGMGFNGHIATHQINDGSQPFPILWSKELMIAKKKTYPGNGSSIEQVD